MAQARKPQFQLQNVHEKPVFMLHIKKKKDSYPVKSCPFASHAQPGLHLSSHPPLSLASLESIIFVNSDGIKRFKTRVSLSQLGA